MNYFTCCRLISASLLIGIVTAVADTAKIKNSSPYVINAKIVDPTSGAVLANFSAKPNQTQTFDVGLSCPQLIKVMAKGSPTGTTLSRQCNTSTHSHEFTIKGRAMRTIEDTDIFSLEEGIR
jgi:hypothetical protein